MSPRSFANPLATVRAGMIACALAATLTSCGGHDAEPRVDPRPVVPVQTAVGAEDPWHDGLELTAAVMPLQRATPGTVLLGRVVEVRVSEGQTVRRGDVLARVESRDVAARVAQAEAGVAAARAMEQNSATMLERMRRLHARQAASQRDLDDAIAGHEAARASLVAAQEQVKAAEVMLGYAEIRAPFDGSVVDKRVEVGDTAAPGVPLFVIEDTARVKVEAQVAESVGTLLAIGDPVEVEIQGVTRDGRLTELIPAADPRSRTFTVRTMLDNADGSLRSGMFARMRLRQAESLRVSAHESALVRQGPLNGLFVVESSSDGGPARARLRWVTLGRTREGRVEVLTGLRAGERYVLHPPAQLEDGQPVEERS